MSKTEIILLITTMLPVLLGTLGAILRTSENQRVQAIGAALQGAGVDVAKVSRAVGDARRGMPRGKVSQ
jgi:stage V sporulation protein SpoVS